MLILHCLMGYWKLVKKFLSPVSEIFSDMSFALENGDAGSIYESFENAYAKL